MAYLNLIETDDLEEGIAEAGFDLFDDTDCNRIRIESDYYHSEIEDQLGDYTEQVEAELIDWLNNNADTLRPLIAQDITINVQYTYNTNHLPTKFQVIDTELTHEE